jgi:hypothetical protein
MNKQPRQLAADPTTNPKILAKLSARPDSDILELVASNPNTPINILWSLIGEYSHQVVENPIFSLIILEDPDWIMGIPIHDLMRAMNQPSIPEILLFEMIKCPSTQLQRLAFEAKARSQKTSRLTLAEMIIRDENLIPESLKNPNFTLDLLWDLVLRTYNHSEFINRFSLKFITARSHFSERFTSSDIANVWEVLVQYIMANNKNDVKLSLLSTQGFPLKYVQLLIDSLDFSARLKLANGNTYKETLEFLVHDINCAQDLQLQINQAVAKNWNTKQETLMVFAMSRSVELKLSLLEGRYLSLEVLIHLISDPDSTIRKKLLDHKLRYDQLSELLNHPNPTVKDFALEYSNINNSDEM